MKIRRKIVIPALVGAAYAALTLLLAPIGYGSIQCRVSEVLCILPFFLPSTIAGLFLGCALANIASPLGPIDIIFGSAATLIAGLCTALAGRAWRRGGRMPGLWRQILACLMPVLWNGIIIGAELAYIYTPENYWAGFLVNGAQVALGEAAVMLALGLPLMSWLIKSPVAAKFLANK